MTSSFNAWLNVLLLMDDGLSDTDIHELGYTWAFVLDCREDWYDEVLYDEVDYYNYYDD